MGLDCCTSYSTLTQNYIRAVQGTLFGDLACGNPSGLVCSEASFFCTPLEMRKLEEADGMEPAAGHMLPPGFIPGRPRK